MPNEIVVDCAATPLQQSIVDLDILRAGHSKNC
jgi:hypothetical protein